MAEEKQPSLTQELEKTLGFRIVRIRGEKFTSLWLIDKKRRRFIVDEHSLKMWRLLKKMLHGQRKKEGKSG